MIEALEDLPDAGVVVDAEDELALDSFQGFGQDFEIIRGETVFVVSAFVIWGIAVKEGAGLVVSGDQVFPGKVFYPNVGQTEVNIAHFLFQA